MDCAIWVMARLLCLLHFRFVLTFPTLSQFVGSRLLLRRTFLVNSEQDYRLTVWRIKQSDLPLLRLQVDLPQTAHPLTKVFNPIAIWRWALFPHVQDERVDDRLSFRTFGIGFAWIYRVRPLSDIIAHDVSQIVLVQALHSVTSIDAIFQWLVRKMLWFRALSSEEAGTGRRKIRTLPGCPAPRLPRL
jgi:hypothetical protein